MAVKKIIMRPEGGNDYADELHPKTSADMVVGQELFGEVLGTNTYALTSTKVTDLYSGLRVTARFANSNTGASTLNINGLGAKPIVKAGGSALSSGNLKANGVYTLVYDGLNFQLQGEGGEYGTAQASDVLSGKTIGTDSGLVTGTIPSKSAQTYTPKTTNQTITAGQYLSGTQTIAGDPDLIAANIVSGKNIFGVTGLAGPSEIFEQSTNYPAYVYGHMNGSAHSVSNTADGILMRSKGGDGASGEVVIILTTPINLTGKKRLSVVGMTSSTDEEQAMRFGFATSTAINNSFTASTAVGANAGRSTSGKLDVTNLNGSYYLKILIWRGDAAYYRTWAGSTYYGMYVHHFYLA